MSTTFLALYTELGSRLLNSGTWSPAQLKRCINGALLHLNDLGGYYTMIDETLTVLASTVEYTLPAGVARPEDVIGFEIEQDAGDAYRAETRYRVRATHGALPTFTATLKVYFAEALPEAAGRKIRTLYKANYPALSADADVTEASAEFLYFYGVFLAHSEALANPGQTARGMHEAEAKRAYDVATALIPFAVPKAPARAPKPAED